MIKHYTKRMTAGDTVTEDESLIVFPSLNDHVSNFFYFSSKKHGCALRLSLDEESQ